MQTSGPIKRGSIVALDFPPILGKVLNVNRNRTAFLVDFGEFVKWFQVRRLRLAPSITYRPVKHFQRAPAAPTDGCGAYFPPGSAATEIPSEEQGQLPGTF